MGVAGGEGHPCIPSPPLLPSPSNHPTPPTSTTRGLLVKTNDMHFIIYLSSLVRAIVALHGVVQNKIQYKDHVRVPWWFGWLVGLWV